MRLSPFILCAVVFGCTAGPESQQDSKETIERDAGCGSSGVDGGATDVPNNAHDAGSSSFMLPPGSVFKWERAGAAYYMGADGKKYEFRRVHNGDDTVFQTWFAYSDLIILTQEQVASIPHGGYVRLHPGVMIMTFGENPEAWVVSQYGVIHAVTPEAATELYGPLWDTFSILHLPIEFMADYTIGIPIQRASQINLSNQISSAKIECETSTVANCSALQVGN